MCANGWDEQEATVVCKTLGYDTTDHGKGRYTILSMSIKISSLTFIFQCQLYPALVEVQAPFSHRAFSVQIMTPHFMSVPEQIKTKVSVSMWQESSVKVCGKVFSTFVYWRCAGLVLSPTAPCLSNGFTDCDNCSTGCVVSDHSCSCRSDCYEAGDCCPDVSHVQNCLGESSFPVHNIILSWITTPPTDKECETGEVRLVSGVTNSSGRLEVCGNEVWGNVCNHLKYWGPDNAAVVCHQLGFSEVGKIRNLFFQLVLMDICLPLIGAFVVAASVFGPVSGHIVVGEVHCTGTETELLECSHDSIGDHLCGPPLKSEDDVGVAISCYGMHFQSHVDDELCIPDSYDLFSDENSSCKDGEVRLQDGTDPFNGRVEVCQYRTWGSVCTSQWDHNDARVVCKQLGYDPEGCSCVSVCVCACACACARVCVCVCVLVTLSFSRSKGYGGVWSSRGWTSVSE